MAYKKSHFITNELIKLFYEIIKNQFIPFPVAIFVPLIYLLKLLQMCWFYKLHLTISFFLLILKTCLIKKNCLYIEKKKEYSKINQINKFFLGYRLDHKLFFAHLVYKIGKGLKNTTSNYLKFLIMDGVKLNWGISWSNFRTIFKNRRFIIWIPS